MAEDLRFEILEHDSDEELAEKRNQKVRCWVGTWNNPKMTDDEFYNTLKELYSLDYLKYAIFQREQGEKTGTIHLQFFVDFKNARTFKWVKENLPYGCHFKPMRTTKTLCRDYCSKLDTRVSASYYEIGEFVEERQRTDLNKIIDMLNAKVPFEEVQKAYPTQCIMYKRQLTEYVQSFQNKENSNKMRDVKVTYIYGNPGTGKTTYMYDMLGFENTFCVDVYDNAMFTNYSNQKNLVFDEFTGKIEITYMNKLLDKFPVQLRGLGTLKYACYDTVYIISNLSLKQQYKKVQEEEPAIYKAFLRRIGRIIRFDDIGVKHIEKDIYDTGFQEKLDVVDELPFDEDLGF